MYKANNGPRLSIEDPNNPDNDISGGTREIGLVFKSFAEAFRLLKDRMLSAATSGETAESILGTIIAANFDEYTELRWQLREVFETDPRFAQYRRSPSPPPPPPYSPPPLTNEAPPPPPPSSKPSRPLPAKPPAGGKKAKESKAKESKESKESKEKLTKLQKKKLASKDRAARLKRLRPDIPKVPTSISNEDAIKLGGYKTQSEMDKDLIMREKGITVAG